MRLNCFRIFWGRLVVFKEMPSKAPVPQKGAREKVDAEKSARDALKTARSHVEKFEQSSKLKAGIAKMYDLSTFEALAKERPKKQGSDNPKMSLEMAQDIDIEKLKQILEKDPTVNSALEAVFENPEKYKPKNIDDIRTVFRERFTAKDEQGFSTLSIEARNLLADLTVHEKIYVFLKAPEIVGRIPMHANEDTAWTWLKKGILESFGIKQRYDLMR